MECIAESGDGAVGRVLRCLLTKGEAVGVSDIGPGKEFNSNSGVVSGGRDWAWFNVWVKS